MKILFFLWKLNPFYRYAVAREQKAPCDKSNRFWKPILVWMCFTSYEKIIKLTGWKISKWEMIKRGTFKEDLFVEHMPFLTYDLWELLVIRFNALRKASDDNSTIVLKNTFDPVEMGKLTEYLESEQGQKILNQIIHNQKIGE